MDSKSKNFIYMFIIFLINSIINFSVDNLKLNNFVTYGNVILTSVLIILLSTSNPANINTEQVSETLDENMVKIMPITLSITIFSIYLIITKIPNLKDLILKIIFFISIVNSLINVIPLPYYLVFAITAIYFIFDFLTPDEFLKQKDYLNNFIAIMSAVSTINMLDVKDTKTGIFLLVGLFFFDIFWVFGTKYLLNLFFPNQDFFKNKIDKFSNQESIMETVAKNVKAPILLKYFTKSDRPMILGLGDIVIPATFIKTLYDSSNNNFSNNYNISIISYIFGLASAIYGSVSSNNGQPALLYIVPALVLPVLFRNTFTDQKIF